MTENTKTPKNKSKSRKAVKKQTSAWDGLKTSVAEALGAAAEEKRNDTLQALLLARGGVRSLSDKYGRYNNEWRSVQQLVERAWTAAAQLEYDRVPVSLLQLMVIVERLQKKIDSGLEV